MLLTLLGQPAAAVPVTWNPADKGPNLTLSGGNLTVTAASGFYDQFVRATQSKTTGKWVFSAVMNTADYTEGVGVCNASQDLTDDFLPLANAIMAMRDESQWKYNGTTVGAKTQFWASATEVMIALDADNRLVWMSSDGGTTWRGSAVGSPSAGTNGQAVGFTGAIFPCVTTSDGRSWAGRFTDADIAGTIPAGFTAWGDAGAISASASQTLGLVTQTANLQTTGGSISASASQTLALPTQTATAAVTVAASASQTLDLVTVAETAAVRVSASAAQTLDLLTATETVAVRVSASATQTLDLVTQTANATASNSRSASANQTLDLITAVETAAVQVSASLSQNLVLLSQTAAAAARVSASASQTLVLLSQTATGTAPITRFVSASQTFVLLSQTAAAAVRVAANGSVTLLPPEQVLDVSGPTWREVLDATENWSSVSAASGIWIPQAGA